MAKYYGSVGYAKTEETRPGIWETVIEERDYYGDLIRNYRKVQSADQLNDNLNISNEISIVADPYAMENIQFMRYIRFMGQKWRISNVEIQYPRLILTIGDVYNVGDQSTS